MEEYLSELTTPLHFALLDGMINSALAVDDYNCTNCLSSAPSSLPASSSSSSSSSNNNNINGINRFAFDCNNLKALEAHDVVDRAISELWVKWSELDECYLKNPILAVDRQQPESKSNSDDGSRLKFTVPAGFYELFTDENELHSNDDLDEPVSRVSTLERFKHNRIPDEIRIEYLSKLYDIFKKVPRYHEIINRRKTSHLDTVRLTNTDSPVPFTSTHTYDDECIPAVPIPMNINNNFAPNSPHSHIKNSSKAEVIYTFTITDSKNNRTQDIDVLGSSTLADLKTVIYCVHDKLVSQAWSPGGPDTNSNGSTICDIINGSFFVIDDKFFTSTVDGTLEIREFLKKQKSHSRKKGKKDRIIVDDETIIFQTFAPNKKAKRENRILNNGGRDTRSEINEYTYDNVHLMADTLIRDLVLIPGKCNLYAHCYCCEHYLYLSDFKTFPLYCNDTETQLASYPRSRFTRNDKKKKCQACLLWPSKWMVAGDRLGATDPCFLCSLCFEMLYYDSSGNLTCENLEIYSYIHDMM